jgi:hypothetical protein
MASIPQAWQDSLGLGMTYTVAQFSVYLPKIVGALIVLVVGIILARIIKKVVVKSLEAIRVSKAVEKTPLELFLKNAELGQKVEEVIGSIFYWLFLLVIIHTSVSLLGLSPLSTFFDKILDYIPHIFTAFLIFIFGVVLAGMVESVIKGTLRSFDAHSARLFAKVASYVVVAITTLAAIAELGIAKEFILILFIGVVSSLALGVGLALGLGGKDTVSKILDSWYKRTRE